MRPLYTLEGFIYDLALEGPPLNKSTSYHRISFSSSFESWYDPEEKLNYTFLNVWTCSYSFKISMIAKKYIDTIHTNYIDN